MGKSIITLNPLDNKKTQLIMSYIGDMANLKSSKKDIRRTLKRTRANASQKSKVRTYLRKAKEIVAEYLRQGVIARWSNHL